MAPRGGYAPAREHRWRRFRPALHRTAREPDPVGPTWRHLTAHLGRVLDVERPAVGEVLERPVEPEAFCDDPRAAVRGRLIEDALERLLLGLDGAGPERLVRRRAGLLERPEVPRPEPDERESRDGRGRHPGSPRPSASVG